MKRQKMRRTNSQIYARIFVVVLVSLVLLRISFITESPTEIPDNPDLSVTRAQHLDPPPASVESELRKCVDNKKDVLLVGNRPVGTYLCDYFPQAKSLTNGCKLTCPARAQDENGQLVGTASFTCTILQKGSQSQMRTADIVVSHYGAVPKKFSHLEPVYTVFYSGESNATEAKRSKQSYQVQYDTVISFHTHRQWFFTWTNRHVTDFLSIAAGKFDWGKPLLWNEKRDAIAIFVSRCKKGGREATINNLKAAYPVHSFGKCLRTHDVQTEFPHCNALGQNRYPTKLCVLRHYKFVLALDNTREEDYVTEKVYHALLSGAVPLFDGAPNADEYLPGGWDSVVRLSDFEIGDRTYNTQQLTETLKQISENTTSRLTELMQWRNPVLSATPHVDNIDDETRTTLSSHWGATFIERLFHEEPTCDLCDAARVKKCRG